MNKNSIILEYKDLLVDVSREYDDLKLYVVIIKDDEFFFWNEYDDEFIEFDNHNGNLYPLLLSNAESKKFKHYTLRNKIEIETAPFIYKNKNNCEVEIYKRYLSKRYSLSDELAEAHIKMQIAAMHLSVTKKKEKFYLQLNSFYSRISEEYKYFGILEDMSIKKTNLRARAFQLSHR